MPTQVEVLFEIEPVTPETSASIKSLFNSALREIIDQSEAKAWLQLAPEVTFEQHLPLTKEQVEFATILLAFAFKEGPNIWQQLQMFLDNLRARLAHRGARGSFTLKIGDKKFEAKGLSDQDSVKLVIDQYIVDLHPRQHG